MSQTSGGDVGSSSPCTADASSSSSSSMGGVCSLFTTTVSPSMHSSASVTVQAAMQVESSTSEQGVSNQGVSEVQTCENQFINNAAQQQQLQATPKRQTVLNISPPPEDLFDNSRMSCQDGGDMADSEHSNNMWLDDSASNFSVASSPSYNDNTEVPRKSRKRSPKQRPGLKQHQNEETIMDVFDADSARGPHYVLSQLGSDVKNNLKVGNGLSDGQKGCPVKKSPALCGQYPSKFEGKELKILVQPETQHRARYLTEGSRGSVKDRTQQGFPTVKLEGHNEPVVLQVFVGTDSGRIKPHGFYQACRVSGRNTTPCIEEDIEGTTVIEVCLDPANNMTLAVDCVGILKLRNADVEARIGIAGSKKKSTRARLVFRVNIPHSDGSQLTLQVASSSILCTQPAGVPEILKKSLHSCSVKGGGEVFLIGKNFLKGAKVIFQENIADENSWKAEAEIDMELFHQNHLIVKVPQYHNQNITSPVSVGIFVVTNAGRSHDMQSFTYTPEPADSEASFNIKKEVAASAQPCSFDDALNVAALKVTSCDLDKAELPNALLDPSHSTSSMIKCEDASPMDVVPNQQSSSVFKTADTVGLSQPVLDISSEASADGSFSVSQGEGDKPAQFQTNAYQTADSLTAIKSQTISQSCAFRAASYQNETLLQQTTSFQRSDAMVESRRTQEGEVLHSDGSMINLSVTETQQQPSQSLQDQGQALQQQFASNIFSSDSVGHMQQTSIHPVQSSHFQPNDLSGNRNASLAQQVLESQQQQLSAVLFSGSSSNQSAQQSLEQTKEQLSATVFQQSNVMQADLNSVLFPTSESAVGSSSETAASNRVDNISGPESTLLNHQQQRVESTAAMVIGMQHSVCSSGQVQSELFQNSVPGNLNGNLQQSDIFQQASHVISGLQTSDGTQLPLQCGLFASSAPISGNESVRTSQQLGVSESSSIFPVSSSVNNEDNSGQPKPIQTSMFQNLIQMQNTTENQPPANLFSSSETIMHIPSTAQQNNLFQQGGEMISVQPAGFLQQPPHSQSPLFHSQSTVTDVPNSQCNIFHSSGPSAQHQKSVTSQEQVQPVLFHSQNEIAVLHSPTVPHDQQGTSMFLSQNPSQEKQLHFFSAQNSLPALQSSLTSEQSVFQQQSQISHLQNAMLSQEQQQKQQQQDIFQTQVTLTTLPSSTLPQNTQTAAVYQPQPSAAGVQNSTSAQEQSVQNILLSAQSVMSSVNTAMTAQEQQQNHLIFNQNQQHQLSSLTTTQEQPNQSLFTQTSMSSIGQEQQSVHFPNQITVSSLQSTGSTQADLQQSQLFQTSSPMHLVESSASSHDQVTLFLSSISALQNNMNQEDIQPAAMFSGQDGIVRIQPASTTQQSHQQQPGLFHTSGTMNQLTNPAVIPQQNTGVFVFELQDDCSQLLNSDTATLSDQLIAMSQAGSMQTKGHITSSLLSQQMSEATQLSSTISTSENMEKIDNLLVTLQGHDGMSF
ncbi:nuclear factor of activated T-cells 5 isoform X2 [Protopterus annectens]|nr:nuclear factor of activated T-cells 5 isoform X2 [Protopterus annectens]XP_043937844.1 nuclear factor of activated T-cells 5 isoform X2 [Protopterus annectens]